MAVAGNGDLYVGTGSYFDFNNGNGDSGGRGRGIYYSNDGGASWSAVTLATGGSTIETAGGNPITPGMQQMVLRLTPTKKTQFGVPLLKGLVSS